MCYSLCSFELNLLEYIKITMGPVIKQSSEYDERIIKNTCNHTHSFKVKNDLHR